MADVAEVQVDVALDRELAVKLSLECNANPRRSGRTTVSKLAPMPVESPTIKHDKKAAKQARAKKSTPQASNEDEMPKSAPAKRGRPKNSAGVRKPNLKRKSAAGYKPASASKPRSVAAETPDVEMRDVDDDTGAPSPPSSSELSDADSSFNLSSASSHPSPEPADAHVIDEAEKRDLLDGSNAENALVPMQDILAPNNADQAIYSNGIQPSAPNAEAVQASVAKRANKGSLQPNTSARRRVSKAPSSQPVVIAPAIDPMLSQQLIVSPFATMDVGQPRDANIQWNGAHYRGATPQDPVAINGNNHVRGVFMQTQGSAQFQAPGGNPEPNVQLGTIGQPPAWADKRQQLCEALNYYKAYQSGSYQCQGIIYAMLIDAESRPHDVFDNEIIITRCGGGRGGVDANGHRAQAKHQESNPIGLAFERAKINKIPLVVIAGSNYHNSARTGACLPHRYNVLAHFHVTDVWFELNDNFKTYCCRLEKIHLGDQSWWATQPYAPSDYGLLAAVYDCRRCGKISKCIFASGWVCLNINCASYFKLVDQESGYEATLNRLDYSPAFKAERTYYSGTAALIPLAPPLMTEQDMIRNARFGTEEIFTKGIVCPRCKCCSRKVQFKKWVCENVNGCNYTYELPIRTLTVKEAQPYLTNMDNYPVCDAAINLRSQAIGHFDVDEFEITGANGEIIGNVRHFKSNELVNALKDGPDDLFREMQDQDFGLERRPVRLKGLAGEMLTSHWASNWGAPYKFVVAQLSKPFRSAPEVLVKALKKMTWAGKRSLGNSGPQFQDFNELLSIGYMENTKIGYHDDGEKELGPTIATLSLGSQAEMLLRPKKNAPENFGPASNNQRGTKKDVLRILLNHGDIIIMHGEGVQKYYEHAVIPKGKLRYALTCRTILPEKLANDAERAEAALLAQLPDGHEAWDYDGDKVILPTEEDQQKKKSAEMVNALQRTLNDLHAMVEDSSSDELSQISGVDDVINAYRRVMGSASPASSSAGSVDSADSAPSAAPVRSNPEFDGTPFEGYVLVEADEQANDPAGATTTSDDELADGVADLDVSGTSPQS